MADKSFGVKQINLIGASGTPTIESPNNLNLNATTVAISTDVTIGGQVQSDLKIGSSYSVGIGSTLPTAKLDVTGHTELDTLNVSGITTLSITTSTDLTAQQLNVSGVSTFTGLIDSNGGLDVTGHTELDNLNVTGVSAFTDNISLGGGNLSVGNAVANLAGIITASPSAGIQSYFGVNVACNSDGSSVIVIGINTFSQGTISLYDKNGSDYDFIGIVTDTTIIVGYAGDELPADCVMSDDGNIFAFSSGAARSVIGAGNTIVVWERSGSTISQLGLIEYDTLTGFGATEGISSGVEFGCSLDMSADGTKFVIGAERDRLSNTGIGTTTFTGRVHVVDRSGSTFTGIATLTPDALYDTSGYRFGWNAVMSDDGSTIVVSQPSVASNEGVIYKFSRVGNTVTQVGLTTTVGNFVRTGAGRGRGLEISGDGSRIFVGCQYGSTASVVGSLLVLDSDLNLLEQIDLSYLPGSASFNNENRKTIQSSYDGKTIVLGSDFYDKCEIYQYSNALGRYALLTTTSDDPNGVAISRDGLRAFIGTKSEPYNLGYYDIFEDSKLLVAGSVGIGTTNPRAKLDVVGDVKVSGSVIAPGSVIQTSFGSTTAQFTNTLAQTYQVIHSTTLISKGENSKYYLSGYAHGYTSVSNRANLGFSVTINGIGITTTRIAGVDGANGDSWGTDSYSGAQYNRSTVWSSSVGSGTTMTFNLLGAGWDSSGCNWNWSTPTFYGHESTLTVMEIGT